jgi:hypothetical protein
MIHQHFEDVEDLAVEFVSLHHLAVFVIQGHKVAKLDSLFSGNHERSSIVIG